nr:DNA methyltransferase [Burkholderia sp. BDU5]
MRSCGKPLDIAREVVRLVPAGGVVCDLFAGSGTFLAAAREAGLHWIGCETNATYHVIASARLDATTDDSGVQAAQQLNETIRRTIE